MVTSLRVRLWTVRGQRDEARHCILPQLTPVFLVHLSAGKQQQLLLQHIDRPPKEHLLHLGRQEAKVSACLQALYFRQVQSIC